MMKVLVLASRPLEHSGITKIEMDVVDYIGSSATLEVACSFGFDNEYGEILNKKKIKCIVLPQKKKTISYMRAIKKIIKDDAIDVVYINGNSAMMVFDALPSKIAGAKVVTHCHNTKTDFPIINYLAKPLFNLVVDKKIGVSKLASEWAYWGRNVTTIPNGVDLDRFKIDLKKRDDFRKQLGIDDKHVYGHIGNFNKQKNHERLLSIFSEILKKDCNAVLLLIGDGELKRHIIETAEQDGLSNNIIYQDFCNRPEDYYQVMDLIIMPSLHEGLCLAALEAQACGVPILVSDVFAEETFVVDNCRKLSLDENDEQWAELSISMINLARKDESEKFLEKKMDYESMMSRIVETIIA